jgi:hypothetical protein
MLPIHVLSRHVVKLKAYASIVPTCTEPTFFIYLSISMLCGLMLLSYPPRIQADQLTEYRLKTAFLYNFATYTQWPKDDSSTFNLCIYGKNPFGDHLDRLLKKSIDKRYIQVHFKTRPEELNDCHLVFISRSAIQKLDTVLEALNNKPVLTVTDHPGAAKQGVALNMNIQDGKITFEANLHVARNAGLNFSSQLLRFASEIYQ